MSTRLVERMLAAAILALTLAARGAVAADDAGTQSVFGYGVGDRALGMGSAFVAAADDASALYWNPAGLSLVERAVVQLDQFGSLGLGFHESYLAAALPSWRWGTGAVTLRQFGASGIEQRDDRNVLIGGTDDSELELALGFGRSVGDLWSLGGAIKLQRQSLAGLSASGVGIDLGGGAQLPWLPGLRGGLGIRNVVQPSLRLDRETLPDPTTVRAGVSYARPLEDAKSVLAEVDLEKSASGALKSHAGFEYRFHEGAALRGGLDNSVLTLGTGIRWGRMGLDYAFENTAVSPTHRVGVSVRFGPTVAESRLAARRAEDQALERRMADAFQQRQTQQVQGLLARADSARAQGQYDDALDAMGALLTLDPTNAAGQALQLDCLRRKAAELERSRDFAGAAATYELALGSAPGDTLAIAGARRCRQESDQSAARTAQVRHTFAAAMDALAAEDFVAARDSFARVLAADPHDQDAARMLERTRQSLARRALSLVDAASRDLRNGRLDDAGTELEQAARLDPNATGLDEANAALRRSRQLAAVTPRTASPDAAAPPPSKPVTGSLSNHEVDELYRLGLEAFKARRTEDAVRYWEHVWAERPGYRGVGEFLKREYLVRGMESFAAGKLEDAVASWEKVLRMYPDDPQARGYVARAQKQIVRSREILGLGN